MGFESGATQLPSPRTQCPVRPVSAKIDYAVSRLGDDAGRWFLIAMVAEPWVLEYRANVHLGMHSISPLLNQQINPQLLPSPGTSASCRSCWQISVEFEKRKRPSFGARPLQYGDHPQGYPLIIHRDITSYREFQSCKDHLSLAGSNCLECCTAITCSKLWNVDTQQG